jgi:hypothetical protein
VLAGSGSLRDAAEDDGFLTAQYVVAVALSLVLLVQVANLLVVAYARGAVRAALDEGVRAAVVADPAGGTCEQRAAEVLTDLLGGPLGAGVGPVRCATEGPLVVATADSRFAGWVPGTPDAAFTTRATAVREPVP